MKLSHLKAIAKRYGLKTTSGPSTSCHCWDMAHAAGSAHAWWCPCSPEYRRGEKATKP